MFDEIKAFARGAYEVLDEAKRTDGLVGVARRSGYVGDVAQFPQRMSEYGNIVAGKSDSFVKDHPIIASAVWNFGWMYLEGWFGENKAANWFYNFMKKKPANEPEDYAAR